MYFLFKNEYRFLNLLKSPKKGIKVERRKIDGDETIWVIIHIHMEMSQ
jgi:hypothetical protein